MDDDLWSKDLFNKWSKDNKDSKEIIKIMQAIHLLMDGCTDNLTRSQLETIQGQMKATIEQCIFWQKQDNRSRFIYDLREFGTWLADFITDAQEKFWENDNNS